LYGAESWTLGNISEIPKNYELEFWPDRVRNEVERVREDSNILHTANRRKANWIGHVCVGTAF